MQRPELPLKILSLLSPVLSWVELGMNTVLPENWNDNSQYKVNSSLTGSSLQHDWLLKQLPTYSLDNIDEVRDYSEKSYPRDFSTIKKRSLNHRLSMPQGYNLIQVFDYLSERYLLWDGGKVVIKRQNMLELHALGLRLPLSFMVQHFYARSVASGDKKLEYVVELQESMNLLPSNASSIRHVIERGVSEGHLHLNSIHATENNWADLLLKPIKNKPEYFSEDDWRLRYLARAAARTLALATTLARGKIELKAQDGITIHKALEEMYLSKKSHSIKEREKYFDKQFDKVIENLGSDYALRSADRLYTNGDLSPGFDKKHFGMFYWLDPWHCSHWNIFYDSAKYPQLKNSRERRDYLRKLHLAAHLALIHSSVKTNEADDQQNQKNASATGNFLHRSLFLYLIVQTHHWQSAVQQGRTTGLSHFKEYYDSSQRRPVEANPGENADAVFEQICHWKGLEVLEGRIAPPKRIQDDLLPWLQAFATKVKEGVRIKKFGLIIHFIKKASFEKNNSITSMKQARYNPRRTQYKKEAFNLFYILQKSSVANPFIVGIDAANLELVTPPEVFAPIFSFLREAPIEVRIAESFDSHAQDNQKLHRAIKRLVKNRRLGMTYHVGEEFRHLLSGLRAIDEVLKFLKPQPGDRIGHGIALGLSPEVWIKQTGAQMLMPKQEWLDTLVWVYHYLGSGDELLARLQIENEIERLAREIYLHNTKSEAVPQHKTESESVSQRKPEKVEPPHITPIILWNAWLLRQLSPDNICLCKNTNEITFKPLTDNGDAAWRWNRIGKKIVKEVSKKIGKNPPYKLLTQYWYDPETRSEGDKLHLVDMEDNSDIWIKVCQKMQHIMQERVIKRQMIIETNPSSNLGIGSMSRMEEHPIFNMAFDQNKKWQRRLRMTVNTDNPGTANTSLAHEYYLLGETLIRMNYPESQVIEWLEWLRQIGKQSSFVRHLPETDDPDMQLMIHTILALAPQKKVGDSAVRLNQWFDRLVGVDEGANSLIQELLETNDRELKVRLLEAIIKKNINRRYN